jgi:hypothetical protein
MSQFDDDDEDFDTDNINVVRKAQRAADKRVKELEKELASFRTDARKNALKGAIEAKGLNPKIAAFVPQDIEPSAVEEWLEEYGEVFAPAGVTAPPSDTPPVEIPSGARVFADVTSAGEPPNGDEGQMMALIQGARTKEDLDKILFGSNY